MLVEYKRVIQQDAVFKTNGGGNHNLFFLKIEFLMNLPRAQRKTEREKDMLVKQPEEVMSYTVTNTRLLLEETGETEVLERAITNRTKKSWWFSQWFPNTQSKPCITSTDAIFITHGFNRGFNRGRSRGNSHHVLHYYFN